MTRTQRYALANAVLLHGYDNLIEFYDELTEHSRDMPTLDQARPVLDSWHAQIIELADKHVPTEVPV